MTAIGKQWNRVTIVRIEIDGFAHTHAFDEVVLLLLNSFRLLGISVDVAVNQFASTGINVAIGANVLLRIPESERPEFPPNTVIFNLDQVHPASPWMRKYYVSLLRTHAVWDYSSTNLARLADNFGIHRTTLLKIGYLPTLSQIEANPVADIDILFYGNLSPRRAKILMDVTETGLNLVSLTGVYGKERDAFISRAKLILNIRFYEFPGITEIVRLAYLLSNRKAVVSEWSEDTAIESDIKQCVVPTKYEDLAKTCMNLARDGAARKAIEDRGYAIFSQRDQAAFLSEAILNTII